MPAKYPLFTLKTEFVHNLLETFIDKPSHLGCGLLGHLLLLSVLFMRRRVSRFPWFTLLIIFYLVRSVGLVAALHFSGHPAALRATMIIDLTDILLQCAVLAELAWIAFGRWAASAALRCPCCWQQADSSSCCG